MDKIIYIAQHLSTGGMPQYLVRQIEEFMGEYEIHVIEWADVTGGIYVVQRNRIRELLGNRLHTIGQNKHDLLDLIEEIDPIAIHFQEIPETFIATEMLNDIYHELRSYRIVVTTHSSTTNPETISYTADKFVLVSEWSKDVFSRCFGDEIPLEIWEYPIDRIEYDKDEAKRMLGFDPSYKHVLNVGLFTRGKNQGELFDLARSFSSEKVLFHFVGNQAVNFKEYWEPIMKEIPVNCIIHGEMSNTYMFYKAADLFYFPSNFELNPIAVKEALSHGLPTFIKRLHTYKDSYDGKVTYISEDVTKNRLAVIEKLGGVDSKVDFSKFDWGKESENQEFQNATIKDMLEVCTYEKFLKIEEGDCVFDIGAGIGEFSYSILHKSPGKLVCIEPGMEEFKILEKNIGDLGICINTSICGFEEDEDDTTEMKVTIERLVDELDIERIDFMRINKNGLEYEIFNEDNEEFILEKLSKASGIFHLGTPELKEKFRHFRNIYLTQFDEYYIYSIDGIDIKWDMWSDRFIQYYSEVFIHIDNRNPKNV